ncbi:YjfI family protein [Lysobacter sp. CA199]|uniref:YjfI family protein n=1 Tax=Lysobacter sp. CA199 TaxID=3455608 RepID=UPI003F8D7671
MSRWTTQELLTRLAASFGADNVEEVPTADGAIQVSLPDSGDLGITIALTDREIFVSTPLVEAAQVRDAAGFNEACLRLNPINPLSNLGLTTINERDVYIVFGEMAPDSSAEQIELEIRTLADNAIDAVEALKSYLVSA